MKKILIIVTLAVLLAVSLFSQTGAEGKGRIKGVVLDEKTGQPLEGVTVKLYSMKAEKYYMPSPKTDGEGRWKALYMRGGAWNIDFEKTGYETKKTTCTVNELPGSKLADIEIKLRKVEGMSLTDEISADLEKGNALYAEKKYPEAMAAYDDILKKNPDVFIIYKNIGNCYFAMEKYDQAVASYEKLFEKQPNSVEVLTLIGNAYVNAKNMEKAMEWYQKIPFEAINDTTALFNIGVNLVNNNKNDLAVNYFKKAVELDVEFAAGYYQLGMTYTALNQIPEAMAALRKFMELAPDSPDFATAKAIVDAFSKVK
jgi:tetratricopeptide (TPR) repeat protein